MKRPVRTTLVFALISALTAVPLSRGLAGFIGWSMAFRSMFWAELLIYGLLLVRWSGKGPGPMLFPMGLLLAASLLPGIHTAYVFLALGVFCCIRSGICFSHAPLRAIAAETLCIGGGAGLVALLGPDSAVTWAIGIWLFFLVQALYFFIVPLPDAGAVGQPMTNAFETAHRGAQRILDDFSPRHSG